MGQVAADEAPVVIVVRLRRYRCCCCGAITVVGPHGLMRGHLYGCATIFVSLWLWAGGRTAAQVRDAVRPWTRSGPSCAGRWASLRRWTRTVSRRLGLDVVESQTLRQRAGRCAQMALSYGAPGRACAASVMAGAVHLG